MIEQKLEDLQNLTIKEMQSMYQKYFNIQVLNRPKEFYIENIGYRMQELEFGGICMKDRKLLRTMYASMQNKKPVKIAPRGTVITKMFKGNPYTVKVLDRGYRFNDKNYKSLSAIAKIITGRKISGNEFFSINKWGTKNG